MKTRKPFVVGNWKMNGDLIANEHLFTALRASIDRSLLSQVEVAIAPPYPYLGQASAWLGDTERLADAAEALCFPGSAQAEEMITRFKASLACSPRLPLPARNTSPVDTHAVCSPTQDKECRDPARCRSPPAKVRQG